MSYNIRLDVAADGENRWDARKDKVAALMKYYEADFIGGQEVQHHQLQYLLGEMKDYSFLGVGRDDGKQGGEYSCIFYKKDKFTVIKQSTFWLSPTPDSISIGWDAAYKRVCTYGLFKNKKTKQLFWVFNTHLDHVGKTARLEGVKLITRKIQELNTKNYPVILSGDFNSRPQDDPIQYIDDLTKTKKNQENKHEMTLTISSFLHNSRAISKQAYGPADTWNAFKFNAKLDGCIDYIFVTNDKHLSVQKFATITDSYDMKYPSDHLPVLATLLMK